MTLIRTPQKIERFRTIQQQILSQLPWPSDLKHENLKVVGYCQGDKINRKQPLNIAHFDSISFLRYSENEKDKKKFLHAIGFREEGKQVTFLVLEYETNR